METTSCNICGCQDAEPLFQMPDWSLGNLNTIFSYVRCNNCGLVYQNPRPDREEIGKYYPEEYECYQVPNRHGPEISRLLKMAFRYGMARRIKNVTRFKQTGRLLDIGCATGVFLESVRDVTQSSGHAEWEVEGVEINPYVAELARQKGLKVTTGDFMDTHFSDSSFDVVTLWDVFEHLHNPKFELAEIYRVLKTDGTLVMRIPNLDSWDAKIFGKFWAGFEPPRHLYVFDKNTISCLLDQAGFYIKQMDTKSSRYLIFIMSLRFFLVGKKVNPHFRDQLINTLNHPVARIISAPLFYFYGFKMGGPLLTITVMKKQG